MSGFPILNPGLWGKASRQSKTVSKDEDPKIWGYDMTGYNLIMIMIDYDYDYDIIWLYVDMIRSCLWYLWRDVRWRDVIYELIYMIWYDHDMMYCMWCKIREAVNPLPSGCKPAADSVHHWDACWYNLDHFHPQCPKRLLNHVPAQDSTAWFSPRVSHRGL